MLRERILQAETYDKQKLAAFVDELNDDEHKLYRMISCQRYLEAAGAPFCKECGMYRDASAFPPCECDPSFHRRTTKTVVSRRSWLHPGPEQQQLPAAPAAAPHVGVG